MEKDINNPAGFKSTDTKFIKILKVAMFAKKLNQLQLAQMLGIRQSQISNWLNGKTEPNYRSMQILRIKLDIHVEHYFE